MGWLSVKDSGLVAGSMLGRRRAMDAGCAADARDAKRTRRPHSARTWGVLSPRERNWRESSRAAAGRLEKRSTPVGAIAGGFERGCGAPTPTAQ